MLLTETKSHHTHQKAKLNMYTKVNYKKTQYQIQKEAEEERKKKEDEEAARVLEEYEASFGESTGQRWVQGGTILPNQVSKKEVVPNSKSSSNYSNQGQPTMEDNGFTRGVYVPKPKFAIQLNTKKPDVPLNSSSTLQQSASTVSQVLYLCIYLYVLYINVYYICEQTMTLIHE